MTKLSKKQREDRKQTIKLLSFSAVTVGAVMALMVGMTMFSGPPVALEGVTLEKAMEDAGLTKGTLRLSGAESDDVTLLVAGSSTCVHCQNFVSTGLSELVDYADEKGWAVDYIAVPNNTAAAASSRALQCFAQATTPQEAIKASYELSSAYAMSEQNESALKDLVEAKVNELGASVDVDACLSSETQFEHAARLRGLAEDLKMRGTPGFFIEQTDAQGVVSFSGYSDWSTTQRQLEKARP
jgi:protein-disulfide isomerase